MVVPAKSKGWATRRLREVVRRAFLLHAGVGAYVSPASNAGGNDVLAEALSLDLPVQMWPTHWAVCPE